MGGFGFGMLVDVQMLGFFQAQHHRTHKHFLAYVLQITTTSSSFLIYRRYSQIAALATKLHFHPAVGLPPKYALQLFPLTEAQLKQRFEGLQEFITEVFSYLITQHEQGFHHDVNSTAGLDMQIFFDFVSHQRNRPPRPVKTLPEWAKPSILQMTNSTSSYDISRSSSAGSLFNLEPKRRNSTWHDGDSMDSEDIRVEDGYNSTFDLTSQLRNELLQAEGNVNALWNCLQVMDQATNAWCSAYSAASQEFKRISEMPLYVKVDPINTETLEDPEIKELTNVDLSMHVLSQLEKIDLAKTKFHRQYVDSVLAPLESLATHVLPDVKHVYWNRLETLQASMEYQDHEENSVDTPNMRRLLQERKNLRKKIHEEVGHSFAALENCHDTFFRQFQVPAHPSESSTPHAPHTGTATSIQPEVKDVLHPLEEEAKIGFDSKHLKVWIWGRPPDTDVSVPILRPKETSILGGQQLVQIACGGEHVLYLTDSGDVYAFGEAERKAHKGSFTSPQLIEEFALEKALHRTKIIQIACGAQHSVGITDIGELYTWGSGEDGRLGHGDMRDRATPRKVMALLRSRVIHASCGGAHTAVLTEDYNVFTFGRGRNGRLGLGDNKWRDTPHEITALPRNTAIIKIICGWNFTIALSMDGKVFSWGKQGEGQCGLGYLDKDQLVPRMIEKLSDIRIVDIACGYTHSLALSNKGQVFSWGLGEYGQLGRGIVYQPVPELVDFSHVLCAPDRLSRVYCGAFHSIATSEHRVMFAWGLNMHGACGLGHTSNRDSPERIDCFVSEKDITIACGQKYSTAIEVDIPKNDDSRLSSVSAATSLTATPLHKVPPTPMEGVYLVPNNSSMITSKITGSTAETRVNIHEKEEELRRATKLWRTRILKEWEECRDTSLAHSMWRQGIPPSIRAKVWPLAIGNKLKITPDMYQIYRKRAITYKHSEITNEENVIGKEHTLALIDTDLPRTFPSLKLFDSSGPYYEFLLEVLETYACYRPDLGYIQGMSYLAAMLCLHMPQDRYLTFQCLANLMVNEHLFTFYLLDAELSEVYYTLFDELLASHLPKLHRHLNSLGISISMYLMNWLQTLFLQVLPLELAARVFDNFLLDGTVFMFRTALAIHELLKPELICAEIDEAMPILQKNPMYYEMWGDRVTEEDLFGTISKIFVPSHIYSALGRVVNDVFFYEKRKRRFPTNEEPSARASTGGQSVGIGRVKHERRRMYSISDTLNGVLGGF